MTSPPVGGFEPLLIAAAALALLSALLRLRGR